MAASLMPSYPLSHLTTRPLPVSGCMDETASAFVAAGLAWRRLGLVLALVRRRVRLCFVVADEALGCLPVLAAHSSACCIVLLGAAVCITAGSLAGRRRVGCGMKWRLGCCCCCAGGRWCGGCIRGVFVWGLALVVAVCRAASASVAVSSVTASRVRLMSVATLPRYAVAVSSLLPC